MPAADPDADAPGRAFAVGAGGTIVKYTEPGTESLRNYVSIRVTGQDAPPPAGYAFALTDYDLPGDEPYDGFTAGVDLDPGKAADAPVFQILFKAGRSWTREAAAWFKDRAAVAFDCADDEAWPSGLNFAFSGRWSGVYDARVTEPVHPCSMWCSGRVPRRSGPCGGWARRTSPCSLPDRRTAWSRRPW